MPESGKRMKEKRHPLLALVDPSRIPVHVAIIMDGNGRWAKQRGLPRIEGHKAGLDSVKAVVEAALEMGIGHLTLYAFSVENWKRPKDEVSALFSLLSKYVRSETKRILENDIKFRVIGRIEDVRQPARSGLKGLIKKTAGAGGMTLTLALSYGGRTEIADACNALVAEAAETGVARTVTPESISAKMYAPDLPDPDLLIRTSGEYRVSNFLLWQIAYTELCILDVFWPDFRKEHFFEAVLDFQRRERRYGEVAKRDYGTPVRSPSNRHGSGGQGG